MRPTMIAILAAAACALAGCDASTSHRPSDPPSSATSRSSVVAETSSSEPAPPTSSTPISSPTTSSAPISSAPTSPSTTSRPPAANDATQLPRGGTTLLGRVRIVAYYGAAGTGQLGVLGATSPEKAAAAIEHRAQAFAGYGEPVQPAMELIATVAQPDPGPSGAYSNPEPAAVIKTYLRVAHEHRMLLILDLQPGRASFLSQAKRLEPFLRDPSVELALDPEWKVTSGAPGGGRIGSSSAAGINDVGAWLSALVIKDHLPDKLLVVHEFTSTMLPNRQDITQHRGVEMVLHADGFGSPAVKKGVFHRLHFPHPPFGIGFKLFLTQDSTLMSPHAVMQLRPRPDVITYQ